MVRVIEQYEPEFRESMKVSAEEISSPEDCAKRAQALPESARDLLDTLLLASGPGGSISSRFRPQIEALGEPLWRSALLVPQVRPSPGVTVDPRHYAAACNLNPHLERSPFFEHMTRPAADGSPSLPPSDARRDAIVFAALLEKETPPLNRDGSLRANVEQRLIQSLGGDSDRWNLALRLARTGGLVRSVNGKLLGFPESPLRRIRNPEELMEPEDRTSAVVLLRLVDEAWIDLEALCELLCLRARTVLFSPDEEDQYQEHPAHAFNEDNWETLEAASLRRAADVLVRIGRLESQQGELGPASLRRPQGIPMGAPGILVTPDLDILIAPGELPIEAYGRLCRLAPYVDGDRAHRHRLTREGMAADISAGHKDAHEFLNEYARFPLPDSVVSCLKEWSRSAARVSVWTGVNILEVDGVLTREVSEWDRQIDYQGEPTGRFEMDGDLIRVPFGQDSLRVRARVGQVGSPQGTQAGAWTYQLEPNQIGNPEALLSQLREHIEDCIVPAPVEAAVWAHSGESRFHAEDALVVHLPLKAAEALQRDPIAGEMLGRCIQDCQFLVSRSDLPALTDRLTTLGFSESDPEA